MNRTASYDSPISTSFSISAETQIRFLEHVVVKMSLDINGYTRGYDYQDLYHYLTYGYKQETASESLDFDYIFDGKGASRNERDVYDWLANRHTRRGDIQIELTSPQGMKSVLLPYRNYDFVNENGYEDWPFMTVHHWGESPIGTWTLKVSFKSYYGDVSMSGLSITIYGTASTPASVSGIPSTCDPICVRGCSGIGQENCDACKNFRVDETLECVDKCPNNTVSYKKYCLTGSSNKKIVIIVISVVIPVAFILTVILIVAISCACYYRKRKAVTTGGFQFAPLSQEPENV